MLHQSNCLDGDDLAHSQTPPSLPSSPPYEGICGIMAANAGAAPTQIGSKPPTLLLC